MCYNLDMKTFTKTPVFHLENLVDSWVIFLLGLVPLALNFWDVVSLDLTKTILFQIGVAILWLLLVLQFYFSKKRLQFSASFLPLVVYFVFVLGVTVFSVYPSNSWWGSYVRQSGLWGNLFYLSWAFIILFSLSLSDKPQRLTRINNYIKGVSLVSLPISIYGLLQVSGYDFITWAESPAATGRALSFLGQPTYLAGFLLLLIPLSFYLIKISQGIWRWLGVSILIIQLAALIATGTRSAIFILLVSWLVFIIYRTKKISSKFLGRSIVSIILVFVLSALWLNFYNPNRFQEFRNWRAGSLGLRWELWSEGVKASAKKPWLGYGLDNQAEAYVYQYSPELMKYLRPDSYSDRAHNLFLDTFLTGGAWGLLWLLLFLWVLIRRYPQAEEADKQLALHLAVAGLIYFIFLQFNFTVIVTAVYIWFLLAVFLSLSSPTPKDNSYRPRFFWLIIILLIPLSFGVVKYSFGRLKADYYHYQAVEALSRQAYFTAVILDSYVLETKIDNITRHFYQSKFSLIASEHLLLASDEVGRTGLLNWLNYSMAGLEYYSFEDRFAKALILGMGGAIDNAQAELDSLKILVPEMPKLYLAAGDVYLTNNKLQEAEQEFQHAANLVPDYNLELNPDQKRRLSEYRQIINKRLAYIAILLKK